MCLLLIGLSCRGRKIALLILSLVFYTMLCDGRLNFFMVIFYIGMLCLLDILPSFNTLALQNSSTKFDTRPIKTFLLALALTFFISMVSILTALELINTKGGLRHIDLFFTLTHIVSRLMNSSGFGKRPLVGEDRRDL